MSNAGVHFYRSTCLDYRMIAALWGLIANEVMGPAASWLQRML